MSGGGRRELSFPLVGLRSVDTDSPFYEVNTNETVCCYAVSYATRVCHVRRARQ